MHTYTKRTVLLLMIIANSTSVKLKARRTGTRCYDCNAEFNCNTGVCYGERCLKTITQDLYVVKGCDNRSQKISSNTKLNGQGADDLGCTIIDLLGLKNEVCFCDDEDYCNSTVATKYANIIIIIAIASFNTIISIKTLYVCNSIF